MTGARDRKRAERQKRKRRAVERPAVPMEAETVATEPSNGDQPPPDFLGRQLRRRPALADTLLN